MLSTGNLLILKIGFAFRAPKMKSWWVFPMKKNTEWCGSNSRKSNNKGGNMLLINIEVNHSNLTKKKNSDSDHKQSLYFAITEGFFFLLNWAFYKGSLRSMCGNLPAVSLDKDGHTEHTETVGFPSAIFTVVTATHSAWEPTQVPKSCNFLPFVNTLPGARYYTVQL